MIMLFTRRPIIFFSIMLFSLVSINPLSGQGDNDVYWEPKLSVSYDLNTRYSLQTGLNLRQDFNWNHSEFGKIKKAEGQIFMTRSTFTGNKFSLGYVHSGSNPFHSSTIYESRATLQYSFKTLVMNQSVSHRARFENRFYSDNYFMRIRYRLNYSAPINGARLDEGEFYWIVSNELLWNFDRQNHDLENRFLLGVGLLPKKAQKLQLALQYRSSDLNMSDVGHAFFVATAFYFRV